MAKLSMTFEQGYALWENPNITPRYYEAVQRFINDRMFSTGSDCARNYEGIEEGWCLWPTKGGRAGYVNVPGRDDVGDGPGSYAYVAKRHGVAHADWMASLGGFDAHASSTVRKRTGAV